MSSISPLPLRPTTLLDRSAAVFAIITGICITLMIRGYRFGESNHAVYLIEAFRRIHPGTFDNDWWTRSTLQYHVVFNALTAWLTRAGILQQAFLIGYLALAALLHCGWYRLVRELDGTVSTYFISVILFYVLAGGLGLGHYHFLQDSCFLPSNIANVAMLWGLMYWIAGRWTASGFCLGIAGLFHINHAIVAIGLWSAHSIIETVRFSPKACPSPGDSSSHRFWMRASWMPTRPGWRLGLFFVATLSAAAIIPALRTVLSRSGKLPLHEFVDLFVRLRHPHHFDPRTWHWALWVAFLLPIPFFIYDARKFRASSIKMSRAFDLFCVLGILSIIALIGAGLFYVSEALIQLNLYRFTIYIKILTCIGLARLIVNTRESTSRRRKRRVAFFAATAVLGVSIVSPGWRHLGVKVAAVRSDPPAFTSVADWAQLHTPVDAVFIVPPELQSFRLRARRAIVVDYKNVPQLSGELPEWRTRLQAVLKLDDLMRLPRPMTATLDAIAAQYDRVPFDHHVQVSDAYGATYIVLRHAVENARAKLVYAEGGYFLYYLPKP